MEEARPAEGTLLVRGEADVNVVATRDETGVSVLVYHYHDDDEPGPAAEVTVTIDGWAGGAPALRHYRMDEQHSNAFAVWKAMGSPQSPSSAEYARLEAAGQLAVLEEKAVGVENGRIVLRTSLPRQGVSLLRLEA